MKKIYIILIAIALIIIGFWLVFFGRTSKEDFLLEESQISGQDSIKEIVSLTINYGDENSKIFNVEFKERMTAFDLLNTKAEELNLKTKTYDAGIFIETIGDKENGQDGKYWLYYVNEEMPMVSADNMELKPGDKVEFRFEESPF